MRMVSAVLLALVAACERTSSPSSGSDPPISDSAFAALQARGASLQGMGIDQSAARHRFDDLPDGGRIQLQQDIQEGAAVEQIRTHLRHIASAFSQGQFQIPAFVHDRAEVPGTRTMREKHSLIRYDFRELPRGGEVRIVSSDSAAIRAVHEFLAFQRGEHRAAGHSMH